MVLLDGMGDHGSRFVALAPQQVADLWREAGSHPGFTLKVRRHAHYGLLDQPDPLGPHPELVVKSFDEFLGAL